MEFTEQQVQTCYVWTRGFYKSKAKAPNKVYDAEVNPAKHQSRTMALQLGANQLLPRRYKEPGWSHLDVGNYIRRHELQLGNCGEMCAVVVSFIREYIPEAPIKLGHLSRPANHVFVIVGDSDIEGKNMQDLLAFQPSGQSYIVDAWAGIFCRTQDYNFHFAAKMQKWDTQGKRILSYEDKVRPFGEYSLTQIQEPILLSDPFAPIP